MAPVGFTKAALFVIITNICVKTPYCGNCYPKEGVNLFGLIGNFGPWELGIVLVIILIIVGPRKLPKVGQSLGKAIQSFRKAKEDDFDELDEKK